MGLLTEYRAAGEDWGRLDVWNPATGGFVRRITPAGSLLATEGSTIVWVGACEAACGHVPLARNP